MILCIADVLKADEVATAREILAGVDFVDGKPTVGVMGGVPKKNEEAVAGDEAVGRLAQMTANALFQNGHFLAAMQPKTITNIIFSRYGDGMEYGTHVDASRVGGARADVSFTLFLNDPIDYDGGELAIENAQGEQLIKLPPGEMVTYPSIVPHRVTPVTRGVRLCAVGWVRSLVRDPAAREILYDLETARNALYQKEGPGREVDLLMKSILNLQRRWMDD